MPFHFTESQVAALIGALVGSSIAVISQIIFYVLAERRRMRDLQLSLTKQRLDEFYSPMLTRLLEIEYKLWLDHEAHINGEMTLPDQERQIWDQQLSDEIAVLDSQIIDIFRRKRWLAFDSTVIECQKLVRYRESMKLKNALPGSQTATAWGDINDLKELHTDVREHHICLMEEMGISKCGQAPLVPAEAGGFRVKGELSLDKYHASLLHKSVGAGASDRSDSGGGAAIGVPSGEEQIASVTFT